MPTQPSPQVHVTTTSGANSLYECRVLTRHSMAGSNVKVADSSLTATIANTARRCRCQQIATCIQLARCVGTIPHRLAVISCAHIQCHPWIADQAELHFNVCRGYPGPGTLLEVSQEDKRTSRDSLHCTWSDTRIDNWPRRCCAGCRIKIHGVASRVRGADGPSNLGRRHQPWHQSHYPCHQSTTCRRRATLDPA